MTKVVIHNHLPKKRTADHWYAVRREGGFTLMQGAGTDGGMWAVKGHGETTRFRSRREAEDHMEANLFALGY